MSEQFLTTAQVAQLLQVAEVTVKTWVHRGTIPSLKLNGARRFRRSDLEAFFAQAQEGSAAGQQ